MRGVRQPFLDRTFLFAKAVLGFPYAVLLKVRKEFFVGNLRDFFPFRLHGVECCLRLALCGRGRTDEVPVSHNENSGHRLRFVLPEGSQCCAKGRRAQHFAVQHSCGVQIRRVLVAARNECAAVDFRDRLSCNRPFRCWRDGILRRKILCERLAAREFRIFNRAARG